MATLETLAKARGGMAEALDLAKAQVQGYTRKDGTVVKPHTDSRVAKPEGKTPHIGKHAAALRKVADNHHSDNDKSVLHMAADEMEAGDHGNLKATVRGADTHQRETILQHVHPDHWEGLGAKPLNHKQALADHEKRFGGKR